MAHATVGLKDAVAVLREHYGVPDPPPTADPFARIAVEEQGADLAGALRRRPSAARQILRAFPGIGEPGAEKILLFSGHESSLAPESNGLRVLARLGLIAEGPLAARCAHARRGSPAVNIRANRRLPR